MTDKGYYCSFCGKRHTEVRKLIAGPSVFICDECTDLCHDIAHEADPSPKRRPILASFDARHLRLLLADASWSAAKAAEALQAYQDKLTEAARSPETTGQVVGFGERGDDGA